MTGRDDFADLVEKVARQGDQAAFTVLFDHFGPRIKAYLLRLGADMAVAEEITQDVMVTLWRKAVQFDRGKATVSTWLYRIARNRRIDFLRRNRDPELDAHEPMLTPEHEPDPGDVIDAQTREARVRAALGSLPVEQVELVKLSFFQGLSHSEIAEQSGLPLGTVKSRIRLAFGRLRKGLEADAAVDVE